MCLEAYEEGDYLADDSCLKLIEQRRDVCRQGESAAQCDFLILAEFGRHECAKRSQAEIAIVEDRRGRSPHTPHKENCSGPPNFITVSA